MHRLRNITAGGFPEVYMNAYATMKPSSSSPVDTVTLMASNQNPFAHWTAGNVNSNNSNWNSNSGPPPSIVGALPYLNTTYPLPPDDLIKFTFTSFNPTILNCTVLGPHNRPYFLVVTDASMPGYTIWKDVEQKNIALVEWQSSPLVEARGILPKQKASSWLRLAPDRRCAFSDQLRVAPAVEVAYFMKS